MIWGDPNQLRVYYESLKICETDWRSNRQRTCCNTVVVCSSCLLLLQPLLGHCLHCDPTYPQVMFEKIKVKSLAIFNTAVRCPKISRFQGTDFCSQFEKGWAQRDTPKCDHPGPGWSRQCKNCCLLYHTTYNVIMYCNIIQWYTRVLYNSTT